MADLFDPVTVGFSRAIGVTGFLLYVMNYTALTLRWLSSDHITYFVISGLAASLVLIGLMQEFNLASALIQIFWIAISTVAILIRLFGSRRRGRLVSG